MAQSKIRGFALVVLILIIGSVIGVAATILGVRAPARHAIAARNHQRTIDVSSVVNAVYQYSLDTNGTLPANITTTPTEICATGAKSCTGRVTLSVLTKNNKYLAHLPRDPQCTKYCAADGTGYIISKNDKNVVTVRALYAEPSKRL